MANFIGSLAKDRQCSRKAGSTLAMLGAGTGKEPVSASSFSSQDRSNA